MTEGKTQATERPAGASLPGQTRRTVSGQGSASGGDRSDLVTPNGRTKIADAVVAKVAGMAAREIGGVHDMGAGVSRTIGSVKERLPGGMGGGQSSSQGVSVQVGERQAAIDIDLIVEYGASIPELAAAVRDNVIEEVEHMCGLDVVEVNIDVADIHLPGEEAREDSQPSEPRVR
ncbi:Asp23/Gls24 family envelope stress response protein [Actinomadura sp. 21ATH]|uniref:Asp23/Gls24 family envelope stress response protein n=1 Tax=Actinomadura sp. 21ATH TaxID=1735444 RepID=UPI0035C17CBE